MRLALALTAAGLIAGCATTEPFSYVYGGRYYKAPLDTYDTLVISVDGWHTLQRWTYVEPGVRQVVVQGPATAGFAYGEQRTLQLDIKPCTRYWIAARKEGRLSQDFEPYVDYSEPIAGCKS